MPPGEESIVFTLVCYIVDAFTICVVSRASAPLHFFLCSRSSSLRLSDPNIHKMNSEMVKSRMMMLTGREMTDVVDADVTVGWML
jgi:hypothetical protein